MILLKNFLSKDILNIFCDASIRQRGKIKDGCYGAIAVNENETIINSIYRICSNTTNNNAEIKGIRAAISLAVMYKNDFPIINIFSDSQISILGIRDRYQTWKCGQDGLLRGYTGEPIKSQEIYIEINNMIDDYNLRVNFWHQKGHVKNTYDSLKEAKHVFIASNGIRQSIDINLIRFISNYNNIVDQTSRSILYTTDIYSQQFFDPIKFYYDGNILI